MVKKYFKFGQYILLSTLCLCGALNAQISDNIEVFLNVDDVVIDCYRGTTNIVVATDSGIRPSVELVSGNGLLIDREGRGIRYTCGAGDETLEYIQIRILTDGNLKYNPIDQVINIPITSTSLEDLVVIQKITEVDRLHNSDIRDISLPSILDIRGLDGNEFLDYDYKILIKEWPIRNGDQIVNASYQEGYYGRIISTNTTSNNAYYNMNFNDSPIIKHWTTTTNISESNAETDATYINHVKTAKKYLRFMPWYEEYNKDLKVVFDVELRNPVTGEKRLIEDIEILYKNQYVNNSIEFIPVTVDGTFTYYCGLRNQSIIQRNIGTNFRNLTKVSGPASLTSNDSNVARRYTYINTGTVTAGETTFDYTDNDNQQKELIVNTVKLPTKAYGPALQELPMNVNSIRVTDINDNFVRHGFNLENTVDIDGSSYVSTEYGLGINTTTNYLIESIGPGNLISSYNANTVFFASGVTGEQDITIRIFNNHNCYDSDTHTVTIRRLNHSNNIPSLTMNNTPNNGSTISLGNFPVTLNMTSTVEDVDISYKILNGSESGLAIENNQIVLANPSNFKRGRIIIEVTAKKEGYVTRTQLLAYDIIPYRSDSDLKINYNRELKYFSDNDLLERFLHKGSGQGDNYYALSENKTFIAGQEISNIDWELIPTSLESKYDKYAMSGRVIYYAKSNSNPVLMGWKKSDIILVEAGSKSNFLSSFVEETILDDTNIPNYIYEKVVGMPNEVLNTSSLGVGSGYTSYGNKLLSTGSESFTSSNGNNLNIVSDVDGTQIFMYFRSNTGTSTTRREGLVVIYTEERDLLVDELKDPLPGVSWEDFTLMCQQETEVRIVLNSGRPVTVTGNNIDITNLTTHDYNASSTSVPGSTHRLNTRLANGTNSINLRIRADGDGVYELFDETITIPVKKSPHKVEILNEVTFIPGVTSGTQSIFPINTHSYNIPGINNVRIPPAISIRNKINGLYLTGTTTNLGIVYDVVGEDNNVVTMFTNDNDRHYYRINNNSVRNIDQVMRVRQHSGTSNYNNCYEFEFPDNDTFIVRVVDPEDVAVITQTINDITRRYGADLYNLDSTSTSVNTIDNISTSPRMHSREGIPFSYRIIDGDLTAFNVEGERGNILTLSKTGRDFSATTIRVEAYIPEDLQDGIRHYTTSQFNFRIEPRPIKNSAIGGKNLYDIEAGEWLVEGFRLTDGVTSQNVDMTQTDIRNSVMPFVYYDDTPEDLNMDIDYRGDLDNLTENYWSIYSDHPAYYFYDRVPYEIIKKKPYTLNRTSIILVEGDNALNVGLGRSDREVSIIDDHYAIITNNSGSNVSVRGLNVGNTYLVITYPENDLYYETTLQIPIIVLESLREETLFSVDDVHVNIAGPYGTFYIPVETNRNNISLSLNYSPSLPSGVSISYSAVNKQFTLNYNPSSPLNIQGGPYTVNYSAGSNNSFNAFNGSFNIVIEDDRNDPNFPSTNVIEIPVKTVLGNGYDFDMQLGHYSSITTAWVGTPPSNLNRNVINNGDGTQVLRFTSSNVNSLVGNTYRIRVNVAGTIAYKGGSKEFDVVFIEDREEDDIIISPSHLVIRTSELNETGTTYYKFDVSSNSSGSMTVVTPLVGANANVWASSSGRLVEVGVGSLYSQSFDESGIYEYTVTIAADNTYRGGTAAFTIEYVDEREDTILNIEDVEVYCNKESFVDIEIETNSKGTRDLRDAMTNGNISMSSASINNQYIRLSDTNSDGNQVRTYILRIRETNWNKPQEEEFQVTYKMNGIRVIGNIQLGDVINLQRVTLPSNRTHYATNSFTVVDATNTSVHNSIEAENVVIYDKDGNVTNEVELLNTGNYNNFRTVHELKNGMEERVVFNLVNNRSNCYYWETEHENLSYTIAYSGNALVNWPNLNRVINPIHKNRYSLPSTVHGMKIRYEILNEDHIEGAGFWIDGNVIEVDVNNWDWNYSHILVRATVDGDNIYTEQSRDFIVEKRVANLTLVVESPISIRNNEIYPIYRLNVNSNGGSSLERSGLNSVTMKTLDSAYISTVLGYNEDVGININVNWASPTSFNVNSGDNGSYTIAWNLTPNDNYRQQSTTFSTGFVVAFMPQGVPAISDKVVTRGEPLFIEEARSFNTNLYPNRAVVVPGGAANFSSTINQSSPPILTFNFPGEYYVSLLWDRRNQLVKNEFNFNNINGFEDWPIGNINNYSYGIGSTEFKVTVIDTAEEVDLIDQIIVVGVTCDSYTIDISNVDGSDIYAFEYNQSNEINIQYPINNLIELDRGVNNYLSLNKNGEVIKYNLVDLKATIDFYDNEYPLTIEGINEYTLYYQPGNTAFNNVDLSRLIQHGYNQEMGVYRTHDGNISTLALSAPSTFINLVNGMSITGIRSQGYSDLKYVMEFYENCNKYYGEFDIRIHNQETTNNIVTLYIYDMPIYSTSSGIGTIIGGVPQELDVSNIKFAVNSSSPKAIEHEVIPLNENTYLEDGLLKVNYEELAKGTYGNRYGFIVNPLLTEGYMLGSSSSNMRAIQTMNVSIETSITNVIDVTYNEFVDLLENGLNSSVSGSLFKMNLNVDGTTQTVSIPTAIDYQLYNNKYSLNWLLSNIEFEYIGERIIWSEFWDYELESYIYNQGLVHEIAVRSTLKHINWNATIRLRIMDIDGVNKQKEFINSMETMNSGTSRNISLHRSPAGYSLIENTNPDVVQVNSYGSGSNIVNITGLKAGSSTLIFDKPGTDIRWIIAVTVIGEREVQFSHPANLSCPGTLLLSWNRDIDIINLRKGSENLSYDVSGNELAVNISALGNNLLTLEYEEDGVPGLYDFSVNVVTNLNTAVQKTIFSLGETGELNDILYNNGNIINVEQIKGSSVLSLNEQEWTASNIGIGEYEFTVVSLCNEIKKVNIVIMVVDDLEQQNIIIDGQTIALKSTISEALANVAHTFEYGDSDINYILNEDAEIELVYGSQRTITREQAQLGVYKNADFRKGSVVYKVEFEGYTGYFAIKVEPKIVNVDVHNKNLIYMGTAIDASSISNANLAWGYDDSSVTGNSIVVDWIPYYGLSRGQIGLNFVKSGSNLIISSNNEGYVFNVTGNVIWENKKITRGYEDEYIPLNVNNRIGLDLDSTPKTVVIEEGGVATTIMSEGIIDDYSGDLIDIKNYGSLLNIIGLSEGDVKIYVTYPQDAIYKEETRLITIDVIEGLLQSDTILTNINEVRCMNSQDENIRIYILDVETSSGIEPEIEIISYNNDEFTGDVTYEMMSFPNEDLTGSVTGLRVIFWRNLYGGGTRERGVEGYGSELTVRYTSYGNEEYAGFVEERVLHLERDLQRSFIPVQQLVYNHEGEIGTYLDLRNITTLGAIIGVNYDLFTEHSNFVRLDDRIYFIGPFTGDIEFSASVEDCIEIDETVVYSVSVNVTGVSYVEDGSQVETDLEDIEFIVIDYEERVSVNLTGYNNLNIISGNATLTGHMLYISEEQPINEPVILEHENGLLGIETVRTIIWQLNRGWIDGEYQYDVLSDKDLKGIPAYNNANITDYFEPVDQRNWAYGRPWNEYFSKNSNGTYVALNGVNNLYDLRIYDEDIAGNRYVATYEILVGNFIYAYLEEEKTADLNNNVTNLTFIRSVNGDSGVGLYLIEGLQEGISENDYYTIIVSEEAFGTMYNSTYWFNCYNRRVDFSFDNGSIGFGEVIYKMTLNEDEYILELPSSGLINKNVGGVSLAYSGSSAHLSFSFTLNSILDVDNLKLEVYNNVSGKTYYSSLEYLSPDIQFDLETFNINKYGVYRINDLIEINSNMSGVSLDITGVEFNSSNIYGNLINLNEDGIVYIDYNVIYCDTIIESGSAEIIVGDIEIINQLVNRLVINTNDFEYNIPQLIEGVSNSELQISTDANFLSINNGVISIQDTNAYTQGLYNLYAEYKNTEYSIVLDIRRSNLEIRQVRYLDKDTREEVYPSILQYRYTTAGAWSNLNISSIYNYNSITLGNANIPNVINENTHYTIAIEGINNLYNVIGRLRYVLIKEVNEDLGTENNKIEENIMAELTLGCGEQASYYDLSNITEDLDNLTVVNGDDIYIVGSSVWVSRNNIGNTLNIVIDTEFIKYNLYLLVKEENQSENRNITINLASNRDYNINELLKAYNIVLRDISVSYNNNVLYNDGVLTVAQVSENTNTTLYITGKDECDANVSVVANTSIYTYLYTPEFNVYVDRNDMAIGDVANITIETSGNNNYSIYYNNIIGPESLSASDNTSFSVMGMSLGLGVIEIIRYPIDTNEEIMTETVEININSKKQGIINATDIEIECTETRVNIRNFVQTNGKTRYEVIGSSKAYVVGNNLVLNGETNNFQLNVIIDATNEVEYNSHTVPVNIIKKQNEVLYNIIELSVDEEANIPIVSLYGTPTITSLSSNIDIVNGKLKGLSEGVGTIRVNVTGDYCYEDYSEDVLVNVVSSKDRLIELKSIPEKRVIYEISENGVNVKLRLIFRNMDLNNREILYNIEDMSNNTTIFNGIINEGDLALWNEDNQTIYRDFDVNVTSPGIHTWKASYIYRIRE